jgi:phosphinothricin acetyltransferase
MVDIEPKITVRGLTQHDWPHVARIYAEGIATGQATFELEVPSWVSWDTSHLPEHRFVALAAKHVVGWVAVSPISDRCVYCGVVESSVYVAASARGHGIGRLLLRRLVESTEDLGVWTIQAGMFPENTASIVLHESAGFKLVGRRSRLGKLDGHWRDVLLMERRSAVVN